MHRFRILITCVLSAAATVAAEAEGPESVSFRNEVMPTLSRSGCNLGVCHGNQHGKGGFRLSLRGQHPDRDYRTLVRELGSRRVNLLEPEASLLLRKPTMQVPHQGGRRFGIPSPEYRILRDWISAGLPNDLDSATRLVKLTVTPEQRTLTEPDWSVPLRATAAFADGSERDVTNLAVFEPSSLAVEVTAAGVVRAKTAGTTSVTVRFLEQQRAVRLEFVAARPDFVWQPPSPKNFIDEAVFAKLKRLRMNPSAVCDDATFVRRLWLDVTGLLPSPEKSRAFVRSTDPDKRPKLIDELLESSEFCDMQALRWADLLRVEEKTLDQTGVTVFHKWIRQSFAEHKPLDDFASELLTARGSTYQQAPANFYRALRTPSERGEVTAQIFLGIRLQCARCHNHPFDRWTQADYYGWSNFFAQVDYKIVENKRRDKLDKNEFAGEQIVLRNPKLPEVVNPETGQPAPLRFLGEAIPQGAASGDDRLQSLADWMVSPRNTRFAATQANRVWFHLMGRGLVDPVDDFRGTNPASHPDLLDRLATEFREHDFDVRHLMRLILNSHTWQLSSEPNSTNADDQTEYSHVLPRRLSAEQLLDAIAQVTQVAPAFGGYPAGTRAVQLPGVRNGGHRHSPPADGDRFLSLFGKPGRLQSCECERSDSTTLAQTFEMVSGELVNSLLGNPQAWYLRDMAGDQPIDSIVDELYWRAIARSPTAAELAAAGRRIEGAESRQAGLQDVAWALLNSNEFLLRH